MLVRFLHCSLSVPSPPSTAPSSTVLPGTDSTEPVITSIESLAASVDALQPAALKENVWIWRLFPKVHPHVLKALFRIIV